jgi:polar amino acid transport system permease protein
MDVEAVGAPPGLQHTADDDEIRAVPIHHYGRWVSAVLVLLAAAWVVRLFALSPNISWAAVRHYLTVGDILNGLKLTIVYTFFGMALGVAVGVMLAVMRLSVNPVLRVVSWFYIWLFRGTPLLIQIIFWFNLALIVPKISIGFSNTAWYFSQTTNSLVTTSVAAVLALGLNEGAYMAEIVRAGILVVDPGQTEAGLALGMKRGLVFRMLVLPQAMRAIIPPTGNELIGLLKSTSLVSVIAAQELLTKAELIYARNLLTIELLIVASLWYLAVTSLLTWGQYYVERHYARGSSNRDLPPTPMQRMRVQFRRTFLSGGAPSGSTGPNSGGAR